MYRTGDLGRWRDDGAILTEDRITGGSQIKLKGLRIELRDVENSILETSNGALTQAVISARGVNAWDPDFLSRTLFSRPIALQRDVNASSRRYDQTFHFPDICIQP